VSHSLSLSPSLSLSLSLSLSSSLSLSQSLSPSVCVLLFFLLLLSPSSILLHSSAEQVLAKEVQANFISVKGPELLQQYQGESEKAVRLLFERARLAMPCVIFFDEIDALCRRRDGMSNASAERVVNQLLTEMDGMTSRGKVSPLAHTQ
jgi:hypothetical protein